MLQPGGSVLYTTDLSVAEKEPMTSERTSEASITCVVAQEHPADVDVVADVLTARGVEVVARATDGATALAAIEALSPTVAVLDLVMPGLAGIEVARLAHERCPGTATILYTGPGQRELLAEAVDAGLRGFTRKEATAEEFLRAVELAAAGATYVDPELVPTLLRGSVTRPTIPLSPREREILRLLADGKTNDEIGKVLHISPHTVRTHLRRAMKKLEADNRTQAVAIALRESFID
jgi:DNA-binding NarL/FixJ family response regulator